MQNKNIFIIVSLAIIVVIIGGVMFMNRGDFAERNREKIEENVRNYVQMYKLDPDDVEIYNIGEPFRIPTGEKSFNIYIRHMGHPYFFIALNGDPDTLLVFEPNEYIIEEIFNELYLEARYDEFKPAIDYLKSLGVEDPLRPEGTKIQYLQTSIGINQEINDELKEAFRRGDDFESLRQYIKDNLEKISQLDRVEIKGRKEGIDEAQADEIFEELKNVLPKSDYDIQIGVKNFSTGETQGLYKYLTIE